MKIRLVSTLLGIWILFVPGGSYSSQESTPLEDHLHRLELRLDDVRRSLEYQPSSASVDLSTERDRTHRHLRSLEGQARRLGAEELLARIETLARRWHVLAESANGVRKLDSEPRIARLPVKGGVVVNDACGDALSIGNGVFVGSTAAASRDGDATCSFDSSAPDVWFRYSSPTGGQIFANTSGSSFPTVLSVHTGCPGTLFNELTCADTFAGQQAALDFFVAAGEEVLLRLSGVDGASGSFRLTVGPPEPFRAP